MKCKIDKPYTPRFCSRRLFLKYAGTVAGFLLTGCKGGSGGSSASGSSPQGQTGNRVVAVRDDLATSWDGKQTWYGSDTFVNQARVDEMVKAGVMSLTGGETETAAWNQLIPNYAKGKKTCIKINANNAGGGGNVIDPLPQLLKALVKGLKAGGIEESDVWFIEPSRTINTRVAQPVKTAYPGVTFYGASETDYSSACTYDSTDPSLTITHKEPFMNASKLPDQLGASTYLIHMPIMKAHGMAGVTLTYKNLYGMFRASTIPKFHSTFFRETNNPMVEIYANANIAGKTVLVLGDGIYGNWTNNTSVPSPWANAFKDSLWPKTIFLSKDPVAVDCVMYDYLDWEKNRSDRDETYIIEAARAGQGIRDHWSNPSEKKYSAIDFIQRDITAG